MRVLPPASHSDSYTYVRTHARLGPVDCGTRMSYVVRRSPDPGPALSTSASAHVRPPPSGSPPPPPPPHAPRPGNQIWIRPPCANGQESRNPGIRGAWEGRTSEPEIARPNARRSEGRSEPRARRGARVMAGTSLPTRSSSGLEATWRLAPAAGPPLREAKVREA